MNVFCILSQTVRVFLAVVCSFCKEPISNIHVRVKAPKHVLIVLADDPILFMQASVAFILNYWIFERELFYY